MISSFNVTSDSQKTEVGSYFISNYPPYSSWNDESLGDIKRSLQSPPSINTPLGLYLHIPFCRKRCKFCYFKVFTDVNASEVQSYVDALSNEISLVSKLPVVGNRTYRFVYFGGGTPSFLSPKQLTMLADRLRRDISWDSAEEVTFECEPGTLSETKVKTLRERLGVTRLSLGVENFSDRILEENGRAHLSKQVFDAWKWIHDASFENVNIDLISGMVGETWDNWRENVRQALVLEPDSVTIYQMELPFNTVYSAGIIGNTIANPVADWTTKRAWVNYAFDELEKAGYAISSAYTMVKNPSKVNFSYRDNLWEGADLIATGIASFGHVSGIHYQNYADLKNYYAALENGTLPLARGLAPTRYQLLIRSMILMLKRGYLDSTFFEKKFGVSIFKNWHHAWAQLIEMGDAEADGGTLRLTRQGLLKVDEILPSFFEPTYRGARYT
jgi:oxygen-independent coproporphyrinogen-3 oxidase